MVSAAEGLSGVHGASTKNQSASRAKPLLRGPLDQPFCVDRPREMDVQVAALRHSVEEGAQRRMDVAQGIEALRGDCRIEVTGDHEKANGGDHRRQQDDR
jgi:hypothetical protein